MHLTYPLKSNIYITLIIVLSSLPLSKGKAMVLSILTGSWYIDANGQNGLQYNAITVEQEV
jgi:hypothetical protein